MIYPWGFLQQFARRLRGASLGAQGEDAADHWLRQRGYRILHRNLRVGPDEVDLLALDPDETTLVIVEVKTRAVRDEKPSPAPEESVGRIKQHHLTRIAARLCQSRRFAGKPIRFDVVTVRWPEHGKPNVRHIPGAFESTL